MTLSYWNGTILGPYKVYTASSRPTSMDASTVFQSNAGPNTPRSLPSWSSIIKSTFPAWIKAMATCRTWVFSRPGNRPPPFSMFSLPSKTRWWPTKASSSPLKTPTIDQQPTVYHILHLITTHLLPSFRRMENTSARFLKYKYPSMKVLP